MSANGSDTASSSATTTSARTAPTETVDVDEAGHARGGAPPRGHVAARGNGRGRGNALARTRQRKGGDGRGRGRPGGARGGLAVVHEKGSDRARGTRSARVAATTSSRRRTSRSRKNPWTTTRSSGCRRRTCTSSRSRRRTRTSTTRRTRTATTTTTDAAHRAPRAAAGPRSTRTPGAEHPAQHPPPDHTLNSPPPHTHTLKHPSLSKHLRQTTQSIPPPPTPSPENTLNLLPRLPYSTIPTRYRLQHPPPDTALDIPSRSASNTPKRIFHSSPTTRYHLQQPQTDISLATNNPIYNSTLHSRCGPNPTTPRPDLYPLPNLYSTSSGYSAPYSTPYSPRALLCLHAKQSSPCFDIALISMYIFLYTCMCRHHSILSDLIRPSSRAAT